MKMFKSQNQLRQVKFYVIFGKDHLTHKDRYMMTKNLLNN